MELVFCRLGNCIIAGLAHLFPEDKQKFAEFLGDEAAPHNLEAGNRKSRSYAGVQSAFGYTLVPSYGPAKLQPGSYLVHHEGSGTPHCVAVVLGIGSDEIDVFDCHVKNTIAASKWFDLCLGAVDKSSVVRFRVFRDTATAVWPDSANRTDLESLLELRAGATRRRCTTQ